MIWRCVLRGFDSGTYTATVEVVGTRGAYLSDVLVNRGIAAVELVTGRAAFLAVVDATNPADAMIIGVW